MQVALNPRTKKKTDEKETLVVQPLVERPSVTVSTDLESAPPPALSSRGRSAMADMEAEGKPAQSVGQAIAPLMARPAPAALPAPPVQDIELSQHPLAPKNDIPVAPELIFSPGEPQQVTAERISPSYRQYNEAVKKFPTEQEYVEEHRPEGFWNRLWSGVKTFGKGTLITSNPLGGVIGATMSAFDPDTEAKITYRNIEEPRERNRQNQLMTQVARELGVHNVLDDNRRQDEQLQENRQYRHQLMTRDQANRDRGFDQDDREYKFRVAQFLEEMKRKASESKTRAEQESYERLYNSAKMHADFGVELPPEIARAIGAPALGGMAKPLNDRNTPQWAAEAAAADPTLYGAQTWNDLVDNPEYASAYQQGLEAAKSFAREGESPEQTLNTLVAGGMYKLPPAKIPAYEMARKNPYPIKNKALGNRQSGSKGQPSQRTRLSVEDARRKYQKRIQSGADRNVERAEFIRQLGIDPETGKPVNQ
jgi:hypothetical protein